MKKQSVHTEMPQERAQHPRNPQIRVKHAPDAAPTLPVSTESLLESQQLPCISRGVLFDKYYLLLRRIRVTTIFSKAT